MDDIKEHGKIEHRLPAQIVAHKSDEPAHWLKVPVQIGWPLAWPIVGVMLLRRDAVVFMMCN